MSSMARAARDKRSARRSEVEQDEFKFMQVRVTGDGFLAVKVAALRHKMSVQDMMVEGINRLMAEWAEDPIENPGAKGSSNSSK